MSSRKKRPPSYAAPPETQLAAETEEHGFASLHQALLGLGLSLDETLSYVHLLGKQSSSNELAELTGFANRRISEALKGLELKGLIKRIPGRPVRFAPVAPGLALPALVRQREREVQSIAEVVGTAARKLDALAQPAETTSYIEVVTGREGVRAQCNALELGAQWEVLGMMKPPLLVSSPETSNQEQEEALSRGIRMRWLYERSLFDRPNTLEEVRGFAALGEESRVLPRLPAKIIIADRKIALVHVTERSVKGPHPVAILTRHQELVEVLHELFEVLWAEATVLFGGAGPPSADAGNDSTKIVELLLTGMKDESIARQLGLSKRTLARRISQLMRDWKTETRFQAGFRMGYEAAQRDAGADMGDAP